MPKNIDNQNQSNANQYPFEPGSGTLGKHREKSRRLHENLGKLSLTEKQAKILQFVEEHIDKVGFPPTVRQAADFFSISAKAAHDHLRAVAKKGYIRLFPGSARGIEVIKSNNKQQESQSPATSMSEILQESAVVPLIGSIAAGVPILAEENVEKQLTFPKAFLPSAGNMFALRVKGDSMEKAGILDGDIAVLKQVSDATSEIKKGDIVAALIDGEATLKRFEKTGSNVILHPENDSYQPIKVSSKDNLSIVGKLVGVYRKY